MASTEGIIRDDPDPNAAAMNEPHIRFRSVHRVQRDEMDMTPMVDVTFLLLIFFMVTAAFRLQKSLEVPAPDQTEEATHVKTIEDFEDDPDFVVVHVDSFNTFRVVTPDNTWEAPSDQELLVRLREAKRGVAGVIHTRLLVAASGDALHEKVVTALDSGSAVGMEEVKLVSVEEE